MAERGGVSKEELDAFVARRAVREATKVPAFGICSENKMEIILC